MLLHFFFTTYMSSNSIFVALLNFWNIKFCHSSYRELYLFFQCVGLWFAFLIFLNFLGSQNNAEQNGESGSSYVFGHRENEYSISLFLDIVLLLFMLNSWNKCYLFVVYVSYVTGYLCMVYNSSACMLSCVILFISKWLSKIIFLISFPSICTSLSKVEHLLLKQCEFIYQLMSNFFR